MRPPVPVRTILATIGLVLLTYVALLLIEKLARILGWLVISGFLAIVLTPAVDWLARQGLRRSMATLLVFLAGVGLIVGGIFVVVRPIVGEVNQFIQELPQFVQQAEEGEGRIGRLVERYNLDEVIEQNQERLQEGLRNAGAPALGVIRSFANTVFAMVTIFVLTFLMVLEAPKMTAAALKLVDDRRRTFIRLVAADCAKAVTGYMAGNLVISGIAGVCTFIFLTIIGVPFAGVLGLWVAMADLIPMVGATLGAIPTVGVAFLTSTRQGIATLIFYVVYQQLENHLLQPTVMSRTVNLNPLMVLVSVLIGVEVFGIVGALLAIPIAGMAQVVVRNVYDERKGEFKDIPSIGTDQIPVATLPDVEA